MDRPLQPSPLAEALPASPLRKLLFGKTYVTPDAADVKRAAKHASAENVAAITGLLRDGVTVGHAAIASTLAAVLIQAGDADAARLLAERVIAEHREIPDPRALDDPSPHAPAAVWIAAGLLAEQPAAADPRDALDRYFATLPEAEEVAWAREIGLGVPSDREWTVRFAVPLVAHPQAGLAVEVAWLPGVSGRRLAHGLPEGLDVWCAGELWSAGPGGRFVTPSGPATAFRLEPGGAELHIQQPPASVRDCPRVLREMCAAAGDAPGWDGFVAKGSKGVTKAPKAVASWLRAAAEA